MEDVSQEAVKDDKTINAVRYAVNALPALEGAFYIPNVIDEELATYLFDQVRVIFFSPLQS
jgi:hypothetical protein